MKDLYIDLYHMCFTYCLPSIVEQIVRLGQGWAQTPQEHFWATFGDTGCPKTGNKNADKSYNVDMSQTCLFYIYENNQPYLCRPCSMKWGAAPLPPLRISRNPVPPKALCYECGTCLRRKFHFGKLPLMAFQILHT